MPKVWQLTASGDSDSSELSGLFIVKDGQTYRLMKQLSSSTINPPTTTMPVFQNFPICGSDWFWTVTTNDLEPQLSGTWSNTDGASQLHNDTGSWQSDAVPDPDEPETEAASD
jgi:hypothetical protein